MRNNLGKKWPESQRKNKPLGPVFSKLRVKYISADGNTIGLTSRLWSDGSCGHPSPSKTAPLHVRCVMSHQQSSIFWPNFIGQQAVLKVFYKHRCKGSPVTWGSGDAAQQHEQDEEKQWHPQAIHGGGGLTWIRTARHQILLQQHTTSPWPKQFVGILNTHCH